MQYNSTIQPTQFIPLYDKTKNIIGQFEISTHVKKSNDDTFTLKTLIKCGSNANIILLKIPRIPIWVSLYFFKVQLAIAMLLYINFLSRSHLHTPILKVPW